MSSEEKNPHSLTVWETTKDEAGLVVTGAVLGCAVGVGGGYIVSQGLGTALVPSLVVGGAVGTVVGGGTAVYVAHRIHESRADAANYADAAIQEMMRRGRFVNANQRRNQQVQDAIAAGVGTALKDVKFPPIPSAEEIGEAVTEGVRDGLEALLPQQQQQPTA